MRERPALPVLVVEDDEPTRRLLKAVLSRAGYQGDFASNGAEAIELIRSKPYAAIVLDVMLPEVGGHQVVDWIRRESISVPVVICSAAGPSVLAAFEGSVAAIVRKPFDVDQLVSAISRSIAREND